MMIYTIGNKEEYERGIAEKASAGDRLMKRGMGQIGRERYRGGAVWATALEAAMWISGQIQKEASRAELGADLADEALRQTRALGVFGVEADWERDCVQYDGEPFRRLIIDRPLAPVPAVASSMTDDGGGPFVPGHAWACGG